MWIRRAELRRVLEQVRKAEARAAAAESALARERKDRMGDVRHVVSQFLRREKTYPLPPTAEEKAEVQEKLANQPPPPLTADQLARREALRQWAKTNGFTQKEADERFTETMNQMMEDE